MNRRHILQITGGAAALSATPLAAQPARVRRANAPTPADAPAELFVTDWGAGKPIVFLSSWAVTQEIWQYQHAHFVDAGYRVIAFDRRGHGRSDEPGQGYDIDTLADDLERVLAARNLTEVCLVGHSMGCSEIVRYLARHGAGRVSRVALISPVTPLLLKTPDNPQGVDGALFDLVRTGWRHDFPKWVADNARPFFMPDTSQAMLDWAVAMMTQIPVRVAIACHRTLAAYDARRDLAAVSVPTLIVHGTHDASAPFALTGEATAKLVPGCVFKAYPDAPHGLMVTHADPLNADLEAFIGSPA